MPDNTKTLGSAIAGGVITVSLMQTLQEKGLLSVNECRDVLNQALRALNPSANPEEGVAATIIGSLLRDRYPAHG
jgi:hypothetical protein